MTQIGSSSGNVFTLFISTLAKDLEKAGANLHRQTVRSVVEGHGEAALLGLNHESGSRTQLSRSLTPPQYVIVRVCSTGNRIIISR